jgi:hypothetical protein
MNILRLTKKMRNQMIKKNRNRSFIRLIVIYKYINVLYKYDKLFYNYIVLWFEIRAN